MRCEPEDFSAERVGFLYRLLGFVGFRTHVGGRWMEMVKMNDCGDFRFIH